MILQKVPQILKTKKLQSEKTISLILEAATKLFVSNGYHGTSITDIALATKLSKGALYCHFTSKGTLLCEIIKRFEIQYLDPMIKVESSTSGDAWGKLHSLVTFSAKFAEKNRELCLLLTTISAELHGSENEFEKEIMRVYNKWTRFIERLVEEGKTQGVFNSNLDTHTLAHVLIALNDGVLLGFSRSRDLLDGPRYIRTFRQLLFHGIKPHSGAKKPVSDSGHNSLP